MNRTEAEAEAGAIHQQLVVQQHVGPHQTLADAFVRVRGRTGMCLMAAQRAASRLGLDSGTKIGRLKRCEVARLARAIERHMGAALTAVAQAR